MTPCPFGPPGQQRHAIYHEPRASVATGTAVLLCPPVGQEYMHSHKPVRQLALALADQGLHVLRFDYLGTGDSAGKVDGGILEQWIGDVALAAAELLDVSGADRLAIVGLRLGALLAAAACARGTPQAAQLLLWDPVVAGGEYLAELQALHEELARTMRPVPPVPSNELVGFRYPDGLRRGLQALDACALAPSLAVPRVDVFASEPRPAYARLRAALDAAGREGTLLRGEEPGRWDDLPETFNVMLAPRTVQALARHLAPAGSTA